MMDMEDSSDEEMSDLSSLPTFGTGSVTHVYSIEDNFENDLLEEEIVYGSYRRLRTDIDDEDTYSADEISLSSSLTGDSNSSISMGGKEHTADKLKKQQVNFTRLDVLILEYLYTKGVIAEHPLLDKMEFTTSNDNDKQIQKSMFAIRKNILNGEIEEAVVKLSEIYDSYRANKELNFRLHFQMLIENVYKNEKFTASNVLDFCCKHLMHLLDDHSQNYEELRETLPILMLNRMQLTLARVEKGREKLAFIVHSCLCDTLLHISEAQSTFSLLINHLFNIHNAYHFLNGSSTLYPEVDELVTGRSPSDVSIQIDENEDITSATSYNTKDVQILRQILGISQKDAIHALRLSEGDLEKAARKELCRMKLNHDVLLTYAKHYCVYRGLLDSSMTDSFQYSTEQMQNLQRFRSMRKAALQNNLPLVLDLVKQMDANYFADNVESLFKLKQSEFMKNVLSKNYDMAIKTSNELLQLATTDELKEQYRNTLLILGFANKLNHCKSVSDLIEQIQKCDTTGPIISDLVQKLNLTPPLLIPLVRYLLYIHSLYVKEIVRDPFESMFELRILKKSDVTASSQVHENEEEFIVTIDERTEDTHTTNTETSDEDDEEEDDDEELDEGHDEPMNEEGRRQAVRQLMEIMRMGEERAEQLLSEHRYSLDRVFRSLFGI